MAVAGHPAPPAWNGEPQARGDWVVEVARPKAQAVWALEAESAVELGETAAARVHLMADRVWLFCTGKGVII